MANVMEYVLKGILKRGKDVRQVFLMGIFGRQSHDIEFDIADPELMRILQKETDEDLTGDGVFVEISLEDGFKGISLYGNFSYYEDEGEIEEGDIVFHTNSKGDIVDVDVGY